MYGTFSDLVEFDSIADALRDDGTIEQNKLGLLRGLCKDLLCGLPQQITLQLRASFDAVCKPDNDAALIKLLQNPLYYEAVLIACLRIGHKAYSRSTMHRGARSFSQAVIRTIKSNLCTTSSIIIPDNVRTLIDHWDYGSNCKYFHSWRRGYSGVSALPTPAQAINSLTAVAEKIKEQNQVINKRQQIQQLIVKHTAQERVSVFVSAEKKSGSYTQNISTFAVYVDYGEIILFTQLDKCSSKMSNFDHETHRRIASNYWPYLARQVEQRDAKCTLRPQSDDQGSYGTRKFTVCSQHLPIGMLDVVTGDPNILVVVELLNVFDLLITGQVRCAGDWKYPNHLINPVIVGDELMLKPIRIDTDTALTLNALNEQGCETNSHPFELGSLSTLNFQHDHTNNPFAFRANKDIRSCIVNFAHELMCRSGASAQEKFQELAGTSLESLFFNTADCTSDLKEQYAFRLANGDYRARHIIEKSLQYLIDQRILTSDVGGLLLNIYRGTRTEDSTALRPSQIYAMVKAMQQKLETNRAMPIHRILVHDAISKPGGTVFKNLKTSFACYIRKKITALVKLIHANIITIQTSELAYNKLASEMHVYVREGFFTNKEAQGFVTQIVRLPKEEAEMLAAGGGTSKTGMFAEGSSETSQTTIAEVVKTKLLAAFNQQCISPVELASNRCYARSGIYNNMTN